MGQARRGWVFRWVEDGDPTIQRMVTGWAIGAAVVALLLASQGNVAAAIGWFAALCTARAAQILDDAGMGAAREGARYLHELTALRGQILAAGARIRQRQASEPATGGRTPGGLILPQ